MAATIAVAVDNSTSSRSQGRIPTLDGWRGIAILLVIADHLNLGFGNPITGLRFIGQHGVLIFFVLSGYLITTLLLREKDESGTISLRNFYLKRAFRILPSAWLYLIAIALIGLPSRQELLSCIFFARNMIVLQNGATTHFWSLSIEEQFYLCWPFALLFLNKRRSACLAGMFVIAIGTWRLIALHHHPAITFYESLATQFRADSLFIGCLGAILSIQINAMQRKHAWLAPASFLTLVVCMAEFKLFPPAIESAAILMLIQATASGRLPRIAAALDSPLLSTVGVLSYSAYIWQQIILTFHSNTSFTVAALKLAIVAIISMLSYRLIETPAIRFGRQFLKKANAQ